MNDWAVVILVTIDEVRIFLQGPRAARYVGQAVKDSEVEEVVSLCRGGTGLGLLQNCLELEDRRSTTPIFCFMLSG